jgi:alpha-maltose-1-phosphate synthase
VSGFLSKRLALIDDSSINQADVAPTRKMGRQMASHSFLKALKKYGGGDPHILKALLPSTPLRDPAPKWESLFVGDPNLGLFAKERHWGDPRRYSLIGITHTLSTPAPLRLLANLPQEPLHPWDALICTSSAARSAVETLWNHSEEFYRCRGGQPAPRPQLPLIPLGIHSEDFTPLSSRRDAKRRLGLPNNAFVVLWTGRLELHCKAHHGATFRALAQAAATYPERPWVLLMYGTAVMPSIPSALKEASASLCPNVEMRLLDGHDLNLGALARTASDAFLSLVDCLQETFGLTPIEAMASGLPVVVSDWNGYRDSVIEGRTGFRIPTQSFEPGWSDLQLDQLARNDNALDWVSARISGQIGVDTVAAGQALARLAASPEMAVAMGCLGKQRARENYDWSVVLQHYSELLNDLHERRQLAMSDPCLAGLANYRPTPALAQIFEAWPSCTINAHTDIKSFGDSADLYRHLQLTMVRIYSNELPPPELILKTFQILETLGNSSLHKLQCMSKPDWSNAEAARLPEALGWLLKHGFAEVAAP